MQKMSIKREQSQAGLSFAERENRRSAAGGKAKFRPQVKNKLLLLLALLITAATGAWAQTGMINGLFSVSPTKRVYFSKGNLQYDGTNWKFAENQWEVLGANGTGATGTATNYPMDFFTWGNIDSPTYNGTTYYTENADLSGITDWGSRMGSGWYTLSKDEWLYLFGMESNKTDKSGHARYRKYFRATVNGLPGIVLLPDDLSGISDIPAESNRGTASNFAKTYTTDAWSAMESAGCVFLPTAGFRKTDASVSHVGWSGFYWESTAYDAGKAYTVGFDNTFVDPAGNFDRTFGFAVRLVIDQYYLTLADGVKDADNWTASTDGTNFGALPIGGLKGDGKETVTLKYNGRLKVKSVTATSDAMPVAVGHALSASVVGEIVGSDGKAYAADDKDILPEGVTAVAIIAYVGSATGEGSPYTHGLAIAMKDAAAGGSVKWSSSRNDESLTNYTQDGPAVTTAQSGLSNSQTSGFDDVSNYPAFYAALHNTITVSDGISAAAPASGTSGWFLPSLYQWNLIVKGLSGQSADLSYSDNNDLTVSSLNTKIEAAGGTGLQSDRYWSSTEYDINSALGFGASFGAVWYYFKDTNRYVRACLAF